MPVSHPSGLRRAAALLTGTALAVSTVVAGGAPAGAAPDGLKLIAVKKSLLGTHYWYQQTYQGLPVIDTYYARHVDTSGAETVTDGRKAITSDISVLPSVAADTASAKAVAAVTKALAGAHAAKTQLAVLPGSTPRLVWSVLSEGRAP